MSIGIANEDALAGLTGDGAGPGDFRPADAAFDLDSVFSEATFPRRELVLGDRKCDVHDPFGFARGDKSARGRNRLE